MKNDATSLCTECDDTDYPDLAECPQCHISEHGADFASQIADHNLCRTCQILNLEEHYED